MKKKYIFITFKGHTVFYFCTDQNCLKRKKKKKKLDTIRRFGFPRKLYKKVNNIILEINKCFRFFKLQTKNS
jgi:hypothetical protein